MIHNRDELKECRQKAKADMETADLSYSGLFRHRLYRNRF